MANLKLKHFARAAVCCLIAVVGCADPDADVPPELLELPGFRTRLQSLEAPCTINVNGFGAVDIEEDYIPNVVACENGNAPPEALKAQAVQARSFIYYKLFVAGATSVSNSQGDQVYRCDRLPNGAAQKHIDAARATKGVYLAWKGSIVASFYVAGQIPSNPDAGDPIGSCNGAGGTGGLNTERYVTYNWGKSDCGIEMTSLGWVPGDCTRNPHNRGCASQNGESCLDRLGWKHQDMFRYYYGADIEITGTTGMCGGQPAPEGNPLDDFCSDKADGGHCMDGLTSVSCLGGMADQSEVCSESCDVGVCDAMPSGTVCADQPDGALCANATDRVECAGGLISSLETCPGGCTDGVCNVGSIDDGTGNNDVINNGVGNNGTGGPNPPGGSGQSGLGGLVGTSSGVEGGGCSTTPSAPSPWWLALGLFGVSRRRR